MGNNQSTTIIDEKNICYEKTNVYIGQGINGPIYMWRDEENEPVVVKELKKSEKYNTKENIMREITMMKNVANNENFIQFIGFAENNDKFFIITKLIDYEDLFDYVATDSNNIDDDEINTIFLNICKAVKILHDMNIAHLDLKLENMMYDPETSKIKIIDFGFALNAIDIILKHAGTLDYAAPEILVKDPYDGKKADIWALGVSLYCLITKCSPFTDINENFEATRNNIISVKYNSKILIDHDQKLLNIIEDIFVSDPEARPDIDQIIEILDNN